MKLNIQVEEDIRIEEELKNQFEEEKI